MKLILLALAILVGMVQGKTPIPSIGEQKKAEKTVREAFKADYQKKDRTDRVSLCARLLSQAADVKDDPAVLYVLLREAKDISAEAFDLCGSYTAIDRLAKTYDVKVEELRNNALSVAKKSVKAPEDGTALAESCLDEVDRLIKTDDFDGAQRLSKEAELLAKTAKDTSLASKASDLQKEIPEIRKEGEGAKKAEVGLAANPDDPQSNQMLGLYLCFVKDDWEKGLTLLLKASDAAFKEVAKKELEHPKEPEAMVDSGDSWWSIAEKKHGLEKSRYQVRAKFWYLAAVNKLKPLQKGKVFDRLKLLGAISKERSIEDFVIGDFEDPDDLKKWALGAYPAPCAKFGKGALSIENFEGTRQYSTTDAVPLDVTPYKILLIDVMFPGDKVNLEVILKSDDGYLSWVNQVGGEPKWTSLRLELKTAKLIGRPSLKNIKAMILTVGTQKKIPMYFDNIVLAKESK